MNQLITFCFNSEDMILAHEVRTFINDEGNVCFIAKDICAALDISNVSKAISRLDDDEKGITKSDTLYNTQEMLYVNESGAYTLILRSNKPEAKRIRRWITHEVLPSIRRTGSYSVRQKDVSDLGVFKQDVLMCLERGLMEVSKISEQLKRDRRTTSTTLRRLVKDGHVSKVAHGVYVKQSETPLLEVITQIRRKYLG